jgi:uncharacterized membrane protein YsdA (DUF1294 family)
LEYLDSFLAFIGIITFAAIANNILFNYISENYGAKPVIVYKLITTLYIYIIPFIPNVYEYLRTFLRMLYPLIIYLYIDKYYYEDKYRARFKYWRIKESVLHIWELLGGWPGALYAQYAFHHKKSKFSYIIVFALCVAINIFGLYLIYFT